MFQGTSDQNVTGYGWEGDTKNEMSQKTGRPKRRLKPADFFRPKLRDTSSRIV